MIVSSKEGNCARIHSRKLTGPTLGKRKIIFKTAFGFWDMLVPQRVVQQKQKWFGLEEWLTSVFPIRPPLHQLWIRPATKSPHHGSTPVRRGDVCWFVLSGQKSSESNHLDKYPDKHWEFYHQLKGKEPRKKSEKKHLTNLNLRGLTNLRLYMNQCNKISHVKKRLTFSFLKKNRFPLRFLRPSIFFSCKKKPVALCFSFLLEGPLTSRKCGGLRISKGTRTIPFPWVVAGGCMASCVG